MRLVTERPGPLNYLHSNGKEATIEFAWGEMGNLVPEGIRLRVEGRIVCSESSGGTWRCFADAKRRAQQMAANWFDRGYS